MLVGRETERAEIERLHRKHEVVSLTGAPGVGKSAIALAVAATRRSSVVDLAGAPPETVALVIAQALGVTLPASAPAEATCALVGRELARRAKHLVVLDEADDVLDVLSKDVLPILVRTAPAARFLVTARGRLRIGAAARVDIAPLATPRASEKDEDEILASPAVRMFVQHAAVARPGYRFGRDNATVVASIVRALDGNPLAIELCASRLSLLGERELAKTLARDAGAFADGAGAARGRSLRHALMLSVDRLAPEEARVLEACAVFHGPFDLDAIVAVSGAMAEPLERLEEASLLRVHESEPRRFTIDASLRAFVLGRQSDEARAALRRRHAEYFAKGGSAFGPRPADDASADETERWHAVEWSLGEGEPELAARVLLGAARTVLARGPLPLFVERLDQVLAKPKALPADIAAELHLASGMARIFGGRRDEALTHLEGAARLAKSKGTQKIRALAESKIGLVRGLKGDTRAALARFDAATKHADRDRDPWVRGIVKKDLANVLSEHGRDDEAVVHLGRARELFREARDVREEAFVLMMLGSRLVDAGRARDAQRDCTAALALFESIGDRRSQGWTCVLLGIASLEDGKAQLARQHLEKALEHVRAVGDGHTEGLALSYLGNVALEQRMLSDAEEAYADARVLLERAGDTGAVASCLAGAAVIDVLSGRRASAIDRFARAKRMVAKDARSARRDAIAILSLVLEPSAKAPAPAKTSEEVRFALRIRALARSERARTTTRKMERAAEWVVAADGRSLQDPSGPLVRVDPKGPSARIVKRLAQERLRHPGRSVSLSAIVTAAWPGESMLATAAKNRVHVTLARLRRAGLEALLVRDDDGYFFDPSTPLRIE